MSVISMKEGERQVSPTLDGIRRDHVARYQWVSYLLGGNSTVIDFACGIGYGAAILADDGHSVTAYDVDRGALQYAEAHYSRPQIAYRRANGDCPGELPASDVAVCFEAIEHLRDPRPLLRALRRAAPRLYASVPNEDVMPYSPAPGIVTAYHHRHYTRDQFAELLAECGWHVDVWYGQNGPESEVEVGVNGRTLIARCVRREGEGFADSYDTPKAVPAVAPEADPEAPATGLHIAVLGLGPSLAEYLDIAKRLGGKHAYCDEVWGINAVAGVILCDRVFHMDDVRVQEIRSAARPDSNIARMLEWLRVHPGPVITSRAHPDYPGLVEFPLQDVLNGLGHDYFNSTAAYAVAYAIHIGARKISLFGLDFTYPNAHDAEKGRACVEFWLGVARARGIEIAIAKTSSLLDAMHPRSDRLYGYDTVKVDVDVQSDGSVKVRFTERETLPTADEIERSYDHSAPIAEQHTRSTEAAATAAPETATAAPQRRRKG